MPIDFRIASVDIEGFRGIPQLTIDFPEDAPTYLIGANNSGKSTVINAIALTLKGGGLYNFTPEKYDFFARSDGTLRQEFAVTLHFEAAEEATLPAVQGVGNPTDVHGIRVEGKTTKRGYEHGHRLIDRDGENITYSPKTPLRGDTKQEYEEHDLGWSPRYARPWDISDHLPDIWLLRPDNLQRSLYQWKTGPLERISSLLTDRFLETEWTLEAADGKDRVMPKTMERVHGFFQEAVRKFPFWKNELRPRLESTLSGYIGRQAGIALQPSVQAIEDWLSQQLAASFSADAGGAVTPLDRMGDGWQSLVRIACLDVLRHYPEQVDEWTLLLYEEPESYLHPHLRRKLRDVLADLAQLEWVVISSTHAPEFTSFAKTQLIVRLWRQGDELAKGDLYTPEVSDAAKFQELLDEQGNHEVLFANAVILCEGKDDYFGLRLYLEKAGVDLDGLSVTILSVGGVQTLPHYARLAKSLGIPWCAVSDEDKDESGQVNPITQRAREDLGDLLDTSDHTPIWAGSLEESLGLEEGKATPEWQQEHLRAKSVREITEEFPDFARTCETVSEWIAKLGDE